jgi:hypothetical protein
MGKYSDYQRIERDFYPTPEKAMLPLLNHIPRGSSFIEPCAGDGALVRHLEKHGHRCHYACDIEPADPKVFKRDAFEMGVCAADYCITNPPWDRKILHPLIKHMRMLAPTWLLFDSNWANTKQASTHLAFCSKIVSVGRVKWFPDSKMTGKEDCAWYLFGKNHAQTIFIGR